MSGRANGAKGSAEAVSSTEPSLALVSAGDLTTAELAERTGWSPASIKRNAGPLGGRLVDGRFLFPSSAVQVAIERRTSTTERVVLGGGPAPREPDVGPRSAAVLERLERGDQTVRIAIDLQEPPEFVLRVREQWVRAHAADAQGIHRCSCGAPAESLVCRACFAQSTRLTDEERRTLAGAEIPTAIRCGCGRVVDEGTCSACLDEIAVVVENGMLVVRAAARVVKSVPLTVLVPTLEAPPVPAPVAPTSTDPPVSDATRALVEQAKQLMAEVRRPIATPEDNNT